MCEENIEKRISPEGHIKDISIPLTIAMFIGIFAEAYFVGSYVKSQMKPKKAIVRNYDELHIINTYDNRPDTTVLYKINDSTFVGQ